MPFTHIEPSVVEKSERLSHDIWRVVLRFDHLAKDTIGKRMIRAADSLGSVISDGASRDTNLDQRRWTKTVDSCLIATQYWVRLADKRDLLSIDDRAAIQASLDHLVQKLRPQRGRAEFKPETDHPQTDAAPWLTVLK